MLASLVFEELLSVSFVSFLDSLSVFLVSMSCTYFDSLFSKTSFVPYVPNVRFISLVFNSFLVRFFIDSSDSFVIFQIPNAVVRFWLQLIY